jgi:hypothetical protein
MTKPTASAAGGAMPAEGHKTRRAALGALASVPALAVLPVIASSTPIDPVFAAIERHRALWDEFLPTVGPQENADEGSAEVIAYMEANDAADEALDAFLTTIPTTLAGLRASLTYAVEIDRDCMLENSGRIAATLLRSPVFAMA